MRSIGPAVTREQCPAFLRNSNGRLDLPGPTQEAMSDSVRPHRRQPTRLLRPWDSSGKNTRVGCHFLLQCMKVKSENEVTQSCPTLSDPIDCSLPGSFAHGIFQARALAWGATAFSAAYLRLFIDISPCNLDSSL